MPMIDIYATAGTFSDPHALAKANRHERCCYRGAKRKRTFDSQVGEIENPKRNKST